MSSKQKKDLKSRKTDTVVDKGQDCARSRLYVVSKSGENRFDGMNIDGFEWLVGGVV